DEVLALQDTYLDPTEANLEARVPRVQDLVTGVDARDVASHRRDDPGAARDCGSGRGGKDQPGSRLRLIGHRLHDDELVERLERDVDAPRLLDHAHTIRGCCVSVTSALDSHLIHGQGESS